MLIWVLCAAANGHNKNIMTNIEILYTLAVLLALAGTVPQMLLLVKVKNSEEFSLTTWLIWIVSQVISFFYALSVGAFAYMAACAVWIAFYVAMAALIVKYRPKDALVVCTQETSADID